MIRSNALKDEPTECAELASLTDFHDKIEHEMLGCAVCIRIKTRKVLGEGFLSAESTRQVVDYGDHAQKPNPGFTPSTSFNPNRQIHNARKRSAPQDEAEERKPVQEKKMFDKMLVRDMIRMEGLTKPEAALKLVQERRRPTRMDEDDRADIPSKEMPWQPVGNIWNIPRDSYSCLLHVDHRRYVAITSNYLTTHPTFRFELNKLEIEGLDERLKEERAKFEKMALDKVKKWKKTPFRHEPIGSRDFFMERQFDRRQEVLGDSNFRDVVKGFLWPRLYHGAYQIRGPDQNYRLTAAEILQPGKLLRLHIPDVRRKCQYDMNSGVLRNHFLVEPAVKIPIQKDEKMIEWSMERGIEFMMDGSTVRNFMCNRWPHRMQTFANRVSIVRRVRNGTIQRVCFVSKPVLISPLDILYLNRQYLKWTAKCELRNKFEPNCNKVKKSVPRSMMSPKSELLAPARSSFSEVKLEPNDKIESMDVSTNEANLDLSGDIETNNQPISKLEIMDTDTNINSTELKSLEAKVPSLSDTPKDLLGDILESMGIFRNGSGPTNDETDTKPNLLSCNDVIEEQVSWQAPESDGSRLKRYVVMNFDSEGKHQILDQLGFHVSVNVKAEFLPELGADKLHVEEEIWNCVTGLLKDSAEDCTLHMYPRIGHCVQMRRVDGKSRVGKLSQAAREMLSSRTYRMCALLDELEKLEEGEYLIYPEGSKMKILKEAEDINPAEIPSEEIEFEKDTTIYNKVSLQKKCFGQPPRFTIDLNRNWNGLDPHLPLVWHMIAGRIPGSFYPMKKSH